MQATISLDKCTGCKVCEIICPEVFQMIYGDRHPKAIVHCDRVSEQAKRFCIDARDCCVPQAIRVIEE